MDSSTAGPPPATKGAGRPAPSGTALVIGGGIAGPVAAMALQRAGIQATVYEAYPLPPKASIFLTLASNGIDALRTIDADRPAVAAWFPTPGICTLTGKHLGTARTGLSLQMVPATR